MQEFWVLEHLLVLLLLIYFPSMLFVLWFLKLENSKRFCLWTPDVITLWEALLTVLQFGLLLLHAYAQDKRVPYLSLLLARSERPEDWVPVEAAVHRDENMVHDKDSELAEDGYGNRGVVDIFSIHNDNTEILLINIKNLPDTDVTEFSDQPPEEISEKENLLSIWKQRLIDAIMVPGSSKETEAPKPSLTHEEIKENQHKLRLLGWEEQGQKSYFFGIWYIFLWFHLMLLILST